MLQIQVLTSQKILRRKYTLKISGNEFVENKGLLTYCRVICEHYRNIAGVNVSFSKILLYLNKGLLCTDLWDAWCADDGDWESDINATERTVLQQ